MIILWLQKYIHSLRELGMSKWHMQSNSTKIQTIFLRHPWESRALQEDPRYIKLILWETRRPYKTTSLAWELNFRKSSLLTRPGKSQPSILWSHIPSLSWHLSPLAQRYPSHRKSNPFQTPQLHCLNPSSQIHNMALLPTVAFLAKDQIT